MAVGASVCDGLDKAFNPTRQSDEEDENPPIRNDAPGGDEENPQTTDNVPGDSLEQLVPINSARHEP